jgi:uncharacterized protein (DUF2141 family)
MYLSDLYFNVSDMKNKKVVIHIHFMIFSSYAGYSLPDDDGAVRENARVDGEVASAQP